MSLRARLARVVGRAAALIGGTRSVYAGAALNRTMADWIWGPISANAELLDLRTLRDRGRELERDNAYAGRYVELASENIVSDVGLRLQAMSYRGPELDDRANAEIERAWLEFSRADVGDARGALSFVDLQRLVVERWKGGDGEALIQLIPGGPHGIQWQLVDADQLDETLWRQRANVDRDGPDVNAIVAGVEIDRRGRAVAYHLWVDHPADLLSRRERVRIPAEWMIHVFTASRPGQYRGITRFARVMKALRHLGGLNEAVLVNMRASACKMGFLEPRDGATPIQDVDGKSKVRFEASPGTIDILPDGYQFATWDPNQPTAQHEQLVHEVLYEISAGLGVAFTSLTGNLTAANYGSQRGGLLAERRGWRRDQLFLARRLASPLFETWLKFASLTGAVKVPSLDVRRYAAHEWLFPGWPWIDPQKDVETGLTEVRAGINSLTSIAAASGRELELVFAQRQKEMKLAEEYGINVDLSLYGPNPKGDPNASDGTAVAGQADANNAGTGRAGPAPLRLARSH